MGKLGVVVHAGAVIAYYRWLAPAAGGDVPAYLWSLALALRAAAVRAARSTTMACCCGYRMA